VGKKRCATFVTQSVMAVAAIQTAKILVLVGSLRTLPYPGASRTWESRESRGKEIDSIKKIGKNTSVISSKLDNHPSVGKLMKFNEGKVGKFQNLKFIQQPCDMLDQELCFASFGSTLPEVEPKGGKGRFSRRVLGGHSAEAFFQRMFIAAPLKKTVRRRQIENEEHSKQTCNF